MTRLPLLLVLLPCNITLLWAAHLQDTPEASECKSVRVPVWYLREEVRNTEWRGSRRDSYTVDMVSISGRTVVVYYEDAKYKSSTREYQKTDQVAIDVGQRIKYSILYYTPSHEEFAVLGQLISRPKFKLPEGDSELKTKVQAMSRYQIANSDLIVEVTCEGVKPVDIQESTE